MNDFLDAPYSSPIVFCLCIGLILFVWFKVACHLAMRKGPAALIAMTALSGIGMVALFVLFIGV